MRPLSVLMIAQYVCVASTTLSGADHCLALPPAGGFVVGSATPTHGDCPLAAAAVTAGAGLGVRTTTLALQLASSTELTARGSTNSLAARDRIDCLEFIQRSSSSFFDGSNFRTLIISAR